MMLGMAPPQLGRYRPQDRVGFADLANDVHAEFGFGYDPVLDADLSDPETHYRHILLIKVDDAVVGSAALTDPRRGAATVKRMYLRPELRGQGWGRRLLDAVTDLAAQDGCERVELDTNDRQPDACRLYERAGFTLLRKRGSTRYYAKELANPEAVTDWRPDNSWQRLPGAEGVGTAGVWRVSADDGAWIVKRIRKTNQSPIRAPTDGGGARSKSPAPESQNRSAVWRHLPTASRRTPTE